MSCRNYCGFVFIYIHGAGRNSVRVQLVLIPAVPVPRERERVGHELKTGEVKALDDIPETPMDISGTYSPSLSLMYALVLVWLHARMRWLLGRPVRALLPHRLACW